MKIETLQVAGQAPAIYAMRNPMNSNSRSDTESNGIDVLWVKPTRHSLSSSRRRGLSTASTSAW